MWNEFDTLVYIVEIIHYKHIRILSSFFCADSNGILNHETLSYDEFYQNGPKMTVMLREFLMPHNSPKLKPIAMYQYHKLHYLDY